MSNITEIRWVIVPAKPILDLYLRFCLLQIQYNTIIVVEYHVIHTCIHLTVVKYTVFKLQGIKKKVYSYS